MTNLDNIKSQNNAILARMHKAIIEDKAEDFATAVNEFAVAMQEAILKDAKELAGVTDRAALAARGVRQLTSEEYKYFSAVREAMKSPDPKMALTNLSVVLPETEIDAVFDYLTENHPLLNAISFQNTGALAKIITSTSSGVASWGELTATITSELGGAFAEVDLSLAKLSAFIPVSNAMLDLGPEWLERWVRTILSEAIAVALEAGYVDGDGKNKPLGMTRKLSGATDGVYPRKTAVTLDAINPNSLGSILNTISQAPNNKRRAVPELLMVVNPSDYYTKVFPATTVRRTDGGWNNDVFPYPTRVVISAAVPSNHAIFGLAKEYMAFVGAGTNGGRIEYSDEYKFLEDVRTYKVKMYATGRAKDENAFVLADITNLAPTVLQVEVTNPPEA